MLIMAMLLMVLVLLQASPAMAVKTVATMLLLLQGKT